MQSVFKFKGVRKGDGSRNMDHRLQMTHNVEPSDWWREALNQTFQSSSDTMSYFHLFLVVCTARCNRLGGNERATSRKNATDEQSLNIRLHGLMLGQRSSGTILYWLLKQELDYSNSSALAFFVQISVSLRLAFNKYSLFLIPDTYWRLYRCCSGK